MDHPPTRTGQKVRQEGWLLFGSRGESGLLFAVGTVGDRAGEGGCLENSSRECDNCLLLWGCSKASLLKVEATVVLCDWLGL